MHIQSALDPGKEALTCLAMPRMEAIGEADQAIGGEQGFEAGGQDCKRSVTIEHGPADEPVADNDVEAIGTFELKDVASGEAASREALACHPGFEGLDRDADTGRKPQGGQFCGALAGAAAKIQKAA